MPPAEETAVEETPAVEAPRDTSSREQRRAAIKDRFAAKGDEPAPSREETTSDEEPQEEESPRELRRRQRAAEPEPEAEEEESQRPKKKRRNQEFRNNIRASAAARHAEKQAAQKAAEEQEGLRSQLEERESELQNLRRINQEIEEAKRAGDFDKAVKLAGIADDVSDVTKRKLGINKRDAGGNADPEIKKILEEQRKEIEALKKEREEETRLRSEQEAEQRYAEELEQLGEALEDSEFEAIVGTEDVPGYRTHKDFKAYYYQLAQQHPNADTEDLEEAAITTFDNYLDGLLEARYGVNGKKLEKLLSNGTVSRNDEASNGSASGGRKPRGPKGLPGQPRESANRRSAKRSGTNLSTQSAESSGTSIMSDPSLSRKARRRRLAERMFGPAD